MAHKQCPILFFSPLTSRGVLQYALITHRIGLSQIAQIAQKGIWVSLRLI